VVRDKPDGDVFCFFVLDLDIDGIVISQFTLFGMKQTKLAEAQGRTDDSHTLLWRYLVDCTCVVTQLRQLHVLTLLLRNLTTQ
jgi:hypothetical protein